MKFLTLFLFGNMEGKEVKKEKKKKKKKVVSLRLC